jgi:hypothetical protein
MIFNMATVAFDSSARLVCALQFQNEAHGSRLPQPTQNPLTLPGLVGPTSAPSAGQNSTSPVNPCHPSYSSHLLTTSPLPRARRSAAARTGGSDHAVACQTNTIWHEPRFSLTQPRTLPPEFARSLSLFAAVSCCRSLSGRPRKDIPEIEVSAILSLYQLGELQAFANARVEVGCKYPDGPVWNDHRVSVAT